MNNSSQISFQMQDLIRGKWTHNSSYHFMLCSSLKSQVFALLDCWNNTEKPDNLLLVVKSWVTFQKFHSKEWNSNVTSSLTLQACRYTSMYVYGECVSTWLMYPASARKGCIHCIVRALGCRAREKLWYHNLKISNFPSRCVKYWDTI